MAKRKPNGYWTKERCELEAKKYSTKTQFQKNERGAVNAAIQHGWYEEITSHMTLKKKTNGDKPDGYWTKERCTKEAKKYKSKTEFRKSNGSAFTAAYQKGWWNEISAHMIVKRTTDGHWTKENCWKEASKYQLKSDFKNGCGSAYLIANRQGWLDEICTHMAFVGNRFQRCVYQIKFNDGSIYIGLTFDPQQRLKEHKLSTKQLTKKFEQYDYEFIVSDFMNAKSAALEEIRLIKEAYLYGMNVLNRNRGGALGGAKEYWIKDRCRNTALKFKTKIALKSEYPGCYKKIIQEGWMDELSGHMNTIRKGKKRIWTKGRCQDEAIKYLCRNDFAKMSKNAYSAAHRYGWLDEICSHMGRQLKPRGYWNLENISNIARRYKTKKDFYTKEKSAYSAACNLGVIEKVTAHMNSKKKPNGYWTKDKCEEESFKYTSLASFREESPSAYTKSKKEGWLSSGEVGAHLNKPQIH